FRTIEFGPITKMGSYVFADSTFLSNVTFGEGTEVIGDWAFVTAAMNLDSITTEGISESNTRIARVVVPGTVKKIGEYAFLNAPNLLSADLDLSGVEEIGMGAFWLCKKVTDVDLRSVVNIGDYAFAESGILSANLASAKQIGVYAFSSSALKELKIPAVERIGANSFGNTQIESLTIPKEFNSLTYLDSWVKISDFGDEVPRTDRYLYSFGAAAFAYNLSLKTITVEEGNPTYFTDEFGVLYGVVSGTKESGKYVLLTYPVGNIHNPNNSYTVLENTVRVGDGALYGVQGLDEIHFPDTVKEIGSLAFFNCSARHYYFTSVQAPVLEAAYDETVANVISELYAYRLGMFYSNFYN
ncbi:MAG: leucine-rich repeat domain-containing protein, partial [Clostridia bacterium]|nr:leucine-rich repeat domain-containing protein [Clostridia bacterium]